MRISSQQVFDSGINAVQRHTAEVVEAQRQISSGHKFNRASESALAAGLGVQITFDNAQFEMFRVNQDHLNQVYASCDTQLKSMFDAMAAFQQTMVQAANGTLSAEGLKTLGAKATSLVDMVEKLANSQDANGQSIFKVTTPGNTEVASTLSLTNGLSKQEVVGGGAGYVDVLGAMKAIRNSLRGYDDLNNPITQAAPSANDFNSMESALNQVTRAQVKVGLLQNQLDAAVQFAESQKLNVETARSNLLDTDLPQATSQLAKSNALLQAAQAIITKLDTNTLFQKL
jgi:flagellin-like hook-associated protein FlgL